MRSGAAADSFAAFRYPEPDTQVMVQVKQIQENGAYVKLVSAGQY